MNDNLNPEVARRQFEGVIADLRAEFVRLIAAKEEQFEQVVGLGWSGEHGDAASFLKHLEQERERLANDAAQTASDIDSTAEVMWLEEVHYKLARMNSIWAKLRAEGVPKDQWPFDADLSWGLQTQAQAEADRESENRKP